MLCSCTINSCTFLYAYSLFLPNFGDFDNKMMEQFHVIGFYLIDFFSEMNV